MQIKLKGVLQKQFNAVFYAISRYTLQYQLMQKTKIQKKEKEPNHFEIIQSHIAQLHLRCDLQPKQLKKIASDISNSLLSIKNKVNLLRIGKQQKKDKIRKQEQTISHLQQQKILLGKKNNELQRTVEEKKTYIKKRQAEFMQTKESLWEINAKLKEEIIELKSEIYEKDEKIQKLILLNRINVSFASSKSFRESISNIEDSHQEEDSSETGMQIYNSQIINTSQISDIETKQVMKENETCSQSELDKLEDVIKQIL